MALDSKTALALYHCGEIAAIAHSLPIRELEEYLENAEPEFVYVPHVKAAIELAKLVQGKRTG